MALNGEVLVVDDVFNAFAEAVQAAFERRVDHDNFTIALSGGSSGVPAYEALSKANIDWSVVNVIWGDERQVPLDHADSSHAVAKRALLDHVGPFKSVHPMVGSADAYEAIVQSLLPIDVVHLGMGPDGHTASLFPDSPALSVTDRLVVETGDDLHPHRRLTLTFPALAQSRLAVFTLVGEGKRDMFTRIRNGEDFPAGHVESEQVLWLVDPAANG